MDGNGILYVADAAAFHHRSIAPGGVVSTLTGLPGAFGSADKSWQRRLFR